MDLKMDGYVVCHEKIKFRSECIKEILKDALVEQRMKEYL